MMFKGLSFLCVTEKRPHFQRFMVEQYSRMRSGISGVEKIELVVVTSCEDVETIRELTTTWRERKLGHIRIITPEGDKLPTTQETLTIDATLPPVGSGHSTMGAKRNRAMELAAHSHFTWLDDDDMQHKYRVQLVHLVGSWSAAGAGFHEDNYSVVVRGNSPLMHVYKHKLANQAKRSHNWYEGIYYRPGIRPFLEMNVGEDHYWMQQFLRPKPELRVVQVGPPPSPLSVNLKHYENISLVSRMSEGDTVWAYDAPEQYVEGDKLWSGVRDLEAQLPPPKDVTRRVKSDS